MQAIHLIEIGLAALGGALVGALSYRFRARQQLGLMQQRLSRSEEARNNAVERSANAREQIAQLSKAISELRRSHQPARALAGRPAEPTAQERRAAAERAFAAASQGSDDDEQKGPVVFANTEPMQY